MIQEKEPPRAMRRKKRSWLEEIEQQNIAALAAGMSYGNYIAKTEPRKNNARKKRSKAI